MFCVGYTDTLTMSVPLQVLKLLGADFDGFENVISSLSLKPLNCWKTTNAYSATA